MPKFILRPKRPYSLLYFFYQPVFPPGADSGGVIEVLAFFWAVSGQSGAYLSLFVRPLIDLKNRNKKNITFYS